MDISKQEEGPKHSTDDTILSAQQFYQHDPLLVLLKDKWHLHHFWISIGAMILPGGVFLLWWFSWARNTQVWLPNDTYSAILQTFVLFPIIFLIYLFIPASIANLFNTLKKNGVIGACRQLTPEAETYKSFVQKLVTWTDQRWWTITILLIITIYALHRILILEIASPSPVPYALRICAVIIYLPLMYVTGISVVRLLLALIFTNLLLLRFTLVVKLLHADGSGGLGIIGRLLWASISIMLWEILLLIATLLSHNLYWLSFPEITLLGIIYLVLTPALLIGWLVFPHLMMVRARDEALQHLKEEYQQAFTQSLAPGQYDTRSLIAGTRHLTALKQRYDLMYGIFPTWPLDTNTVSRIGITVIIPLILPIISSLIPPALHALGFP